MIIWMCEIISVLVVYVMIGTLVKRTSNVFELTTLLKQQNPARQWLHRKHKENNGPPAKRHLNALRRGILRQSRCGAVKIKWATAWDFQQCGMCDQQRLRPACAYAQSDQSLCWSLKYSLTVTLLTEYHLQSVSLKGESTGSYKSTLVKIPHCWKSHVTAQM